MTAVEGLSTWHLALVGNPEHRQDRAVQRADRQPPEGRQLRRASPSSGRRGALPTPAGRSVSLIDLPGTYSLRAPQPRRGGHPRRVLGRLAGETAPDVLVCVADATNLRLVLRLILELKRVGRPMVLALNMYDIAPRRGLEIDLERPRRELGCPIVTTVATRKRRHRGPAAPASTTCCRRARQRQRENTWQPTPASIARGAPRGPAHPEGRRRPPGGPTPSPARSTRSCCIRSPGLAILLAVLFLMFQAVFTWAKPART